MDFKITLKKHIHASRSIWWMIFGFFLTWVILHFDNKFLYIGAIGLFIYLMPAIFLHLQYTLKNKGIKIKIDFENIAVQEKGGEKVYQIRDIKQAILYKGLTANRNSIFSSPMERYHFLRLKMNSNKEIVITCLLASNVEDIALRFRNSGIPYQRKKCGFCTLNLK